MFSNVKYRNVVILFLLISSILFLIFQQYLSKDGFKIINPLFQHPHQIHTLNRKSFQFGNLPEYLIKDENVTPIFFNETCASFPKLDDLKFNNIHWQVQQLNNVNIYLLNAYLDRRPHHKFSPEIRITAMGDNVEDLIQNCEESSYCHIWFHDEKSPLVVKVRECRPLWKKAWGDGGQYLGLLISCPLPTSHAFRVPDSVSFSPTECSTATNNLLIHYDTKRRDEGLRIGVCVKALDFTGEEDDKHFKILEWIELLRLLGVDHIFFYEFYTYPTMKRVLDYYEENGLVTVIPITLPGTLPNNPQVRHRFLFMKKHLTEKRKNEVITYNDCLYRNMYKFDYLALLDIDEILMPTQDFTLKGLLNSTKLLDSLSKKPVTTIVFREAQFFSDLIPPEDETVNSRGYMLQHIYREVNFTRPQTAIKALHRTDRAQTLHNHFPFSCLNKCLNYNLKPNTEGRMQHYKSRNIFKRVLNDTGSTESCIGIYTFKDKTIWRYKEELERRVNEAINDMRLS